VGLQTILGMAAFGVILLLGSGLAHSEEGKEGGKRLPLSYTERPLTLPKMILAPELALAVSRELGTGDVGFGMEVAARFGIIDDFEVNAVVAPVEFAPHVAYTGPKFGATFRFLKDEFEMGARLNVTIITHGSLADAKPNLLAEGGVIFEPGVPMLLHIGKVARLDTGVYVPIQASSSDSGGGGAGLRIPVAFAYDIIEPLHVGANTAFGILNFKDPGKSIYIPLGLFAGYAIATEKGPLLDIDPFFRWPYFATPGSSTDKVNAGVFEAGLAVGLYLYL
jgi:hypothetical protein